MAMVRSRRVRWMQVSRVTRRNQTHRRRYTCPLRNIIKIKEMTHLFIDDVEGEDADAVELLLSSCCAD